MVFGFHHSRHGYTDTAANKDSFNIERYINGLSEFILECNTPMTIAIQGDWGTGKTSIMSMIRERIKKQNNTEIVWFNTWQFSQFNMSDQLASLLMAKLVNRLGGETNDKMKKLLTDVSSLALGFASNGATGGKKIIEAFTGDIIDQVEKIKENFQELINNKIKNDNGRVVIFVDDLDRLQPGRAIELLEVLKIFLDCEKCVFVLAIDYEIVSQGIKEKYGDSLSLEKGKNFFDKIIQVPFKMPVARYDISNYIKKGFDDIQINVDENRIGIYSDLISTSIGRNPRSIKRLFNGFLLLSLIAEEEILKDNQNKEILFALMCLQSKFEKVYNYMLVNQNKIDSDFMKDLLVNPSEICETLNMSQTEATDFQRFMKVFFTVIDKDQNADIDEEELETFKKVMIFSTATSSNDQIATEDVNTEIRSAHKEICKKVITRLNDHYKGNLEFNLTNGRGDNFTYTWISIGRVKNPLLFDVKFYPVESGIGNSQQSNFYIHLSKKGKLSFPHGKPKDYESEGLYGLGNNPLESVRGISSPNYEDDGIYYEGIEYFPTFKIMNDKHSIDVLSDIILNAFKCVEQEFIG